MEYMLNEAIQEQREREGERKRGPENLNLELQFNKL